MTLMLVLTTCLLTSCGTSPPVASATSAAAQVGGAGARAAEARAELRTYDLGYLRPGFDSGMEAAELLSPSISRDGLEAGFDQLDPRAEEEVGYFPFAVESLSKILALAMGEEMQYEGRYFEFVGRNQLLVSAPPDVHRRIAALLEFLAAGFLEQQQLRVEVIALPPRTAPTPAGGLHPAGEVDAWIAGVRGDRATKAEYRRFELGLEAGRTASVDLSREVSFISDYDVEVAQGSFAHDPILSMARLGTRLSARGSRAEGGMFLALVVKTESQVGDIEEREISISGLLGSEKGGADFVSTGGLAQDLRVEKRGLAFNAWLPDGQALVLRSSLDLHATSGHEVLVVRRAPDAGRSPAPTTLKLGKTTLHLVNQESLYPPTFELLGSEDWNTRLPSHLQAFQAWGKHPANPLRMVARLQFEDTPATLRYRAEQLKDSAGWSLRVGPWWLFAFAEGGTEEAIPPAVRDTVQLEFVLRAAGRVPVSLTLPARLGCEAFATLGMESTALSDYDVEVAQFAAVDDPAAIALLDGLMLGARVDRSPDGRTLVDLQVRAHIQKDEPAEVGLEGFSDRNVYLAEFEHLFLDERILLEGGAGKVLLGNAAASEGGTGLVLEVSVR